MKSRNYPKFAMQIILILSLGQFVLANPPHVVSGQAKSEFRNTTSAPDTVYILARSRGEDGDPFWPFQTLDSCDKIWRRFANLLQTDLLDKNADHFINWGFGQSRCYEEGPLRRALIDGYMIPADIEGEKIAKQIMTMFHAQNFYGQHLEFAKALFTSWSLVFEIVRKGSFKREFLGVNAGFKNYSEAKSYLVEVSTALKSVNNVAETKRVLGIYFDENEVGNFIAKHGGVAASAAISAEPTFVGPAFSVDPYFLGYPSSDTLYCVEPDAKCFR